MKEENSGNILSPFTECQNPCISLRLVDPVLSNMIMAWMYRKDDILEGQIPFMGFTIEEFVFNKGSLMKYSGEEKEVLKHAIEIIKNKM